MAYLTIAELKLRSAVDEIKNANSGDDSKLQTLLDYCSLLIDSYVGFSFSKEANKTVYVDGEDSNQIALPQRIITFTSITEINDSYSYDISKVRIVGDKKRKLISSLEDFKEGFYNLAVVGDFGYEDTPDDVEECLVLLCNGYFNIIDDSDTFKKMTSPFLEEAIGDYRYKLDKKINSVTGENVDTTGNTIVDQILNKYRDSISIGVV